MGWSREQAIEYMVENSSNSPSASRTEIDRYIVYPGQACAYKVGQIAISRAKALAIVVGSPALLDAAVATPEQLRAVNALCRYVERARHVPLETSTPQPE